MDANPKLRFNEGKVAAELALTSPSVENVNFENRILFRALFVTRQGDDVTARLWWKPLSPELGSDWKLFIHSVDDQSNIKLNNEIPLNPKLSAQSGHMFLLGQSTIKKPVSSCARRLAVGIFKVDASGTTTSLTAEKGTRDWGNRRIILPLP